MNIKRVITAVVALPFLIAFILKAPPVAFLVFIFVVAASAQKEFNTMYRADSTLGPLSIALGIIMLAAVFTGAEASQVIIIAVAALATVRLFANGKPEGALGDIAPAVMGLLYLPGLLSYHLLVRDVSAPLVLFLYASVWCADSTAYYVGKGLGKRKLYESMSPNKTMAGGVGSVIGGAVGATLIKTLLIPDMSLLLAISTGAVSGFVTISGDLVESMFKRDAGVKDSGTIIPGHGGVLDKVDGAVFAGPAVYYFLLLTGYIK